MIECIYYPLEGHLNLVLQCFYTYEEEVPESIINPKEEACVELERVYLGKDKLICGLHLTSDQWLEIEQWIFEQRAWN